MGLTSEIIPLLCVKDIHLFEGDEVNPEAGGDGEEGDREPADEVGEHQQSHSFGDPVKMQSRLSCLSEQTKFPCILVNQHF